MPPESPERIETKHGWVYAVSGGQLEQLPAWRTCFADQRKDHRFYELIERTIRSGFEYHYFVLEDRTGRIRGVQPFFFRHEDVVAGLGTMARVAVEWMRRAFPNFLKLKMLMVGCTAGEGHLSFAAPEEEAWIAESLHAALHLHARRAKASLVVLKEFPSAYRGVMGCFPRDGYTRIPSMPMVRLGLGYAGFEDYMSKVLSKAMRHSLRRKFKKLADAPPITMEVVNDVTPFVDELYPLYLQVFERSKMTFEKLTKEYLCELGRTMPDRARFFIWRQSGKAVAFSVCLVHGGGIYDEYLGLQYPLALDLHLYFVTLRDILQWAMTNGCTTYLSSALNYDPKLHLKCDLVPLDLYVRHTSPWLNPFFRRIAPLLEPTRREPALRKFPNAHEL
ncbi:MAG: GNAT family N-acetyltransferase [Verrucomicrobia bacterium]|nr:GNAT family N-acetyltransferase [Verrucomicrobiota bacterium]